MRKPARALPTPGPANYRRNTAMSLNNTDRFKSILEPSRRRLRCRDQWLEFYFPFLEALHVRFGGGPIGGHYIGAARKAYGLFGETCDPFFRRTAWKAIQAALQLFSQRRGSN
jgi:hypothetical protein